MFEDRLSRKQCVRVVALEKAIDSYTTRPQTGQRDTIILRATQFEEYLVNGGSEAGDSGPS